MTAPRTPAAIVEEYWQHWSRRDKAAALALLADDVCYALFVPEDVLPFGGVTRGRASISDRLQTILDIFDTFVYSGHVMQVAGTVVHGRVAYEFRHKVTGEVIDGSMRQVIRIEDGRIVDWQEYTDADRVRAFMRLIAYSAA